MSIETIHVHCKPKGSAHRNAYEEEERRQNTRGIYQLAGYMARLNTLFDRAGVILDAPEIHDFVEDVPAVMSEIYLLYLRIGAIRKHLDTTYISEEVAAIMPDVLSVQSTAGEVLDALSNLFDDEAVFDSDDREMSEAEDDEDDEDNDERLCSISIEVTDKVPTQIADLIFRRIDDVVSDVFSEFEIQ